MNKYGTSSQRRVLIVDDSESNRNVLSDILKDMNFKVVLAKDANEGFLIFRTQPSFDIILTDYDMPGPTGVDFIRKIISATAVLPTMILLTAVSLQDSDIQSLINQLAGRPRIHFLSKASPPEKMKEVFRSVI